MLVTEKFDVVVCLSTPPLIAVLGLIAQRRGARFIYKVEDLYPDLAIQLGALKPKSTLTKMLKGISSKLLHSADVCVALDHGMGEALKGRGALNVQVIPNWADGEAIFPDPEFGRVFRAENDLPDRLTVLYSGNLGNAHRFDAVCEAIRRLSSEEVEIQFLFVGAGPRLEEVRVALQGVVGVRFMPYQPRERLHELYNAADIHLITLRDEMAGMLVPSKYAAALAAGKPVLLVGGRGADLHSEIAGEEIGWVCEHEADEVKSAVISALDGSRNLDRMGLAARELFNRKYSKSNCTESWLTMIESLESS
jgi:glycosyltransferase involved in cell wall biosynthesis